MEPVHIFDLLEATRGQASGLDTEAQFSRVCTDSRELRQGDVFWALEGKNYDGHDFAADALRKGAAFCVVSHAKTDKVRGPKVAVDSTLAALGDLARWYRHHRESLVIGVTGSVGKTTTKEMIHAALSATHHGVRSERSFNNDLGLPLSLLGLEADHEYGVFELGASKIGDIRSLCEIACPEVGVIPRVGISHLASFGSLDNIYQAKGELLESLPPHGFAVLGGDDERMRQMAQRALCTSILVGEKQGSQLRATEVEVTAQRLRFVADRKKFEIPGASRQHLTAALCAIAVAKEIGVEIPSIMAGLQKFTVPPGRGRIEACGSWTLIDDTYNANPTSMQAACLSLAEWKADGPKVFVTGDMLELGPDSERYHAELGALAASQKVDHLLAFGPHARNVAQGAIAGGLSPHRIAECTDLSILQLALECVLEPGAVITVKGSRGMRMERVVDWLKQQPQQGHEVIPPPHSAGRAGSGSGGKNPGRRAVA